MPKNLVMGGTGFLGSHIVDMCITPGTFVVISLEEGLTKTVECFKVVEKIA